MIKLELDQKNRFLRVPVGALAAIVDSGADSCQLHLKGYSGAFVVRHKAEVVAEMYEKAERAAMFVPSGYVVEGGPEDVAGEVVAPVMSNKEAAAKKQAETVVAEEALAAKRAQASGMNGSGKKAKGDEAPIGGPRS
jgi:hypothetical protein